MSLALETKNISIGYGQNMVISDLSFELAAGDYMLITGENGAGKSTLVLGLLGLLPLRAGEVIFGGGLTKRDIGYLPQNPQVGKDFPASVMEIVLSGLATKKGLSPFYGKKDKAAARGALDLVKIGELKGRCFRELSGGQKQKVLLARALASGKRMLILDEPIAGLDPDSAKSLYETIARLNKDEGLTILMVTHDVKAAKKYAGKTLEISPRRERNSAVTPANSQAKIKEGKDV
jgi:zinc transport system ATP-binding protein